MKKAISIFPIFLLSLLLASAAAAKTLKFATLAPAGTAWMKEMTAGAERVAERSEGRVKLKFYPGGVMGNDQSVHRKIKIGQLHGGAFTSGGLSEINPGVQAYGLPMLFHSLDEVDYVRERLDPVLKRETEAAGFVLLGITEGGFARILSKQPMRDLESLRGSKVWVPEGDDVGLTVFRALGITPISLPIADVFTGLQTGLIETVPVNPTSAIAFQWHSSTSYMTDVPITYLIGVLAIDKSVFDKLSAKDQLIVREEMGAVFERLDVINREDNEEAKDALKQQGITFLEPAPGEVERWHEIADKSIDEMVRSGVIPGNIVEQVRAYLQEFRGKQ
jgi:TRAP-type C4-dicarboxylate transport system substrate-binding protein